MQFGALGDIHGDFESARRVMRRHPDVPFWLCVGDVADEQGRYQALPAPLYWIKGNNDNFSAIAAGRFPDNLHFLPNAQLLTAGGLRVVGLGGTLAPTWYDTAAADLPYAGMAEAGGDRATGNDEPRRFPSRAAREARGRARIRDDKRRHFVRAEVEACKAFGDIDVFLTHEAPRPYFAGTGPRRNDAGKTPINDVLAAMKPRLHLFGHHHRFTDQERQGVRSVGLDLVGRSYLLVDAVSLAFEMREA